MKTNDGGPAFPCDWKDFQPETGNQVVREQFPGMSLRDWFAGMALQGFASNPDGFANLTTENEFSTRGQWVGFMCRKAYETADAMLAERSRTP